jgi:hypothetical protein
MKSEIENFLKLLAVDKPADTEGLQALARALDILLIAYHRTPDLFEGRDVEAPNVDHKSLAQAASRVFPTFGYYPVVDVRESIDQKISLADATDDLADIAGELTEVLWRLEHVSVEDAAWHFRFGYTTHWGRHLHNLRLYLFERLNG